MTRDPLLRAAVVSGVVAAALVALLRTGPGADAPVVVLVAASLRPVFDECAADFTARTGRAVELRPGGSATLLLQLHTAPADVFAPADDSYLEAAARDGLTGPAVPLARMHAVVVSRRGMPWAALTRPGTRVALAQPATAAIGRRTLEALTAAGQWSTLAANVSVSPDTVTEAATAVQIGAADAAVVWDVVARQHPTLATDRPAELAGVTAAVAAAPVLRTADPAAAEQFLGHLVGPGRAAFARHGFAAP